MQKSCTRTKRENSVKICAKNKSSEQRVCRSSARTHTGTRTMLPDTNRDEHWHTAESKFTCHSICDSLRWICALKIHSATRRQNPIPIFAREEHMSEMRGQGVHAKALRIRASWSEIGRTPGCLGREPPNSISGGGETRNCWRSGHTTAGPEFEFNRSRAAQDKNKRCDRTWRTGWMWRPRWRW